MYRQLQRLFKTSVSLFWLIVFVQCSETIQPTSLHVVSMLEAEASSSDRYMAIEIDTVSKSVFTYDQRSNPKGLGRGFQGCPSIGYNNGIFYAAWFAGTKEEDSNNYITVATSADGGLSWKQNRLMIAPASDSIRHINPSLWNDKYGSLHLSWLVSKGIWDGAANGSWHVKIKEAGGRIFITNPNPLFHGVMNVKPIHFGKDSSEILFPVSGWNIGIEGLPNYTLTPSELNGVFLYKSIYHPINKRIMLPQKFARIPTVFSRDFDEPMIVDLNNNALLLMKRTASEGISLNRSNDGGRTWGTEQIFKEVGLAASSRFYLGKLKSGNLLLVLNNSANREKLMAYLSKDNGKTWPFKLLIDDRLGISYPDVVQNDRSEICMVYDYSRNYDGQIIFSRFSEEDITKGNTKAVKYKVISTLNP
ncbi:BNR repeat-like domain-containing protein [Pseudarcicella hirudinis]|uniref:BNR repeat-like domain-containing protein n=1 Tax=Pseudarcicella hirudinis TaxID=1079859 RepID=A0A1I5YNK2_9BACT|nr:sialidase family protein [Pseudarcicella hirudinis]SFQ45818.1 BNR repeat-like domain-containing protein [Pseudarcicella hirudinis]